MRHATVDLWDLLKGDKDDIDAVEESIDDLIESALDEYGDYETLLEEADDRHVESLEATLDNLEDRKDELQAQYDAAAELLEEIEQDPEDADEDELGWGGTEYRLRALVLSDLAEIQDMMGATIENEADLQGVEGGAMLEAVDRMIAKSPPGAPDAIGQYPPTVAKLILKKGGQLSGMGSSQESTGNSSLRQRMETSTT